MIVDIHTHVFDPKTDFSPQLHADLLRCGIDPSVWGDVKGDHLKNTLAADVSVVFGLQASATGWHVPNEEVAAHVAKARHRLLFFASIDPMQPDCLEELEKCHFELGAVGVKMAPLYQNVYPTDSRCYPIYRYCVKYNLPILFHTGTSFTANVPLDYSRPIHFDAVAVDFPDLCMVLAHLGHPWEVETISVIRRHANVYADISALYTRPWQFFNSMRLVTEYRADHKLLFGSDAPFTTTEGSLDGIRGVNAVIGKSGLPPIPEEVIEGIINRDTLNLLGLPNPKLR
jgi:predicted TIM-barrel fold metal-dependent hydrolase